LCGLDRSLFSFFSPSKNIINNNNNNKKIASLLGKRHKEFSKRCRKIESGWYLRNRIETLASNYNISARGLAIIERSSKD
jgi:hypothetical protein